MTPWSLVAAGAVVEVAARGLLWSTWSPSPHPPRLDTAIVHLIAVVTMVTAMLRLPREPIDGPTRARSLLDAATITVAVALVIWDIRMWTPVGTVRTSSWLVLAVHMAADVAVGAVGLAAVSRARHPGGTPLRAVLPLGIAALAFGVGDMLATGLAVGGSYHPLHVADLFLAGSLVLLGAAAAARHDDDEPQRMPQRERVAVLAAIGPIVLGALAVISVRGAQESIPLAAVLGLATLAVLLLVRLAIALLDNLELSRTLERQVADRTLDLVTREQWFRSLVQNSSDIVIVLDQHGVIRYQSPAIERLFGYDAGALEGSRLGLLLRPDDVRRLDALVAAAVSEPRSTHVVEFPVWHRDGRWCETETVVTSLVDDPDICGLVLNMRDVSERKQLQDRLTHQAYHDSLTGLANRSLYQQRLATALQGAGAQGVAVLFCDLNGFKAVNDTQGHDTGDALLMLVAERVRNAVRPGDLIARFGGDEFAVLIVEEDALHAGREAAERIAATLRQPFKVDAREVRIGVSIGIAVTDASACTPDILLRNADLAMYRAKGDHRVDVVVFEPTMHDQLVAKIEVQDDLAQALGKGQLVLHYQPTVELATGTPVGVEALIRWYHPERGIVPPDKFIAIAEESGYIDAIGEWALFEACRQGVRWQEYAVPGEPFVVGVNISGRQVNPALVDLVRRALDESGLPPQALLLEMTESVLMERTEEAIDVLKRIKTLGARVAIDDFGTGYSSLSYLSRFPVDVLKIDKHFVEGVADHSDRTELARTIVNLGSQMSLRTVAEGIETPRQWAALRQMGCGFGQGFLFARPLPPTGILEILEHSRRPAPARGSDPTGVVTPLRPVQSVPVQAVPVQAVPVQASPSRTSRPNASIA